MEEGGRLSDASLEVPGTPCPPKTRSDLEWDRILETLAARCRSAPGKALALTLPFAESKAAVMRALGELTEAFALDAEGEPLPTFDVVPLDAGLDRARIGATLANPELRGVIACLGAARSLRRFLHSRRERAPLLHAACATAPSLDDVERDLASAFDLDGTLADSASPRLEQLRKELRATRERLVRRLEELIRKHEDILQDGFWTERDGRHVLPVRSDAHERFPGIVHATSGSGATVFVEPRVLVEMGNRQKVLDARVTAEEELVYAALSAKVGFAVEEIAAASRALAHADLRAATVTLAKDLGLSVPEVIDARPGGASIELLAARHPLLTLDGGVVVPSDLTAQGGMAVIVSGPNAGGKTVALKTLGLTALMVRAGLPVPAKAGSRVALFDAVLTDVGDEQNLSKNLSTFSAHVQNLARILDATGPRVLVLLDELAGGTDPREGEALAAGVLDSLCARGGAVVCTTHYEGLKVLALADARFQNASVGFDVATMTPTFRLTMGVPGTSSALAVARRFGIPGTVLERAQRFLSREAITFDEMVEKLGAERRALELARAAAERETSATLRLQQELKLERERLIARGRDAIDQEGEALMASVRRAREDLRAAQAKLRANKITEEDLRAAAKLIDAVAHKTSIGGELEPSSIDEGAGRGELDARSIRVGSRVYVPRLRAEADVIEVLGGGQLRVAAGALKLATSVAEVRAVESNARARSEPPRSARRGSREVRLRSHAFQASAAPAPTPIQTSDNSIDLRGLRVDEAVAMAEQFLDRSLGVGRAVAFLIHGHGTGALREAVREALGRNRWVAHQRPGGLAEGGDGVTVVTLRD